MAIFAQKDGAPEVKALRKNLGLLKQLLRKQRGEGRKKGAKISVDGNIAYLPDKGEAIFVGDLHGDSEALSSILNQTDFYKAVEKKKELFLVFLGDYGDRGSKILETIGAIMDLKLSCPDNVILLRGNHEEKLMAKRDGTYSAFLSSYDEKKGDFLFHFYCRVMKCLPGIAVAPNGVVGVHGGIPNRDIKSLDVLNSKQGVQLIRQMTWNDPRPGFLGRGGNIRGDSVRIFGEDAFNSFMKTARATLMVRSHEYSFSGVRLMFNNRLAAIFSNGSERSQSSAYRQSVKRPVFLRMRLDEKKERFQDSDFFDIIY